MKRLPVILIFIAIFVLLQSCAFVPARRQAVTLDDIIAKLDGQFDEQTSRTIPGAAILFIRNGEVYYRGVFGYKDIESGTRMKSDTVFRVASISKSITALGAMLLVENGLMGLDDSPRTFLEPNGTSRTISGRTIPDHVWGGGMTLFPVINPESSTIRQLLSHTTDGHFAYNNNNYVLLQIIIEEITGQSFCEFTRTNVFEPMNMRSSSFDWNDPALETRMATGYAARHDGSLRAEVVFPRTGENMARGGMSSTIDDLAKVIIEMIRTYNSEENGFILSRHSISRMLTPRAVIGRDHLSQTSMSLGFFARENLADGKVTFYHTGGFSSWISIFEFCPASGDGFIVLTNGGRGRELAEPLRSKWHEYLAGR